ncbi:MAG: FkbM family methyltransferase [Acidithiobacillus sp.]
MNSNADSVLQWTKRTPTRSGNLHVFRNDVGAATRSLLEYGEWAWNEITFMLQFVERGATVIDVGAYVGTHTLAFADHVGTTGHVYSIEAQPASFSVLQRNVMDNHVGQANLIHAAAAATPGILELEAIDTSAASSFGSAAIDIRGNTVSGQASGTSIQIRAITLDSLQLAGAPALIKIDVEGMESAVLKGAKDLLFKYRPVIYAECNSVDSGAQTLKRLQQFGYVVFAHVVDAFNPYNWKKLSRNIFGASREVALLGIPIERRVDAMRITPRPFEDFFELRSLDDLCSAMLLKPQYPSEVIQNSTAMTSPRFPQFLHQLKSASINIPHTVETVPFNPAIGVKIESVAPIESCYSGPLRQSQTAVILHLFYAELWDEIADALFSLGEDFNLYVSVTESAESLVSKISQRFPSAQIFVRPNRGRDIAPRLALAKAAIAAGHEYLLFIHSKKSPHLRYMKPEQIHVDFLSHGDGDRWRRDLLDNLLAPSVVAHVRERFTSAQRVGMIGPAGFWLPLEMVKDANRPRVGPLMDRLGIMVDPRRYGFFAGSMFWARAQALAPLLALDLKPEDFEEESGQVDGTLAHAIERLFAVVTERAGFVVEDTTGHECLRPLGPLLPWLAAQRWSPQESLWAQQALANGTSSTVISLLVMKNGREAFAQATHASLSQQWSPVRVGAIAAGDDPVVTINTTLAEMDAGWLAVLDAGDELAPDATFRLAQSIQNHPEWQIIYTDEDSLTAEGEHVNPHCKPDFNLDYLRSLPYIGALMLIKKTLFDALDGFDPRADGAEDYDFLLRAWERVGDAGIGHIPEVLYHRHQGSSHCRKSVPEILEAGRQALVRHFERLQIPAEVQPGPFPPSFRVRYPLGATPLVSIVIPTRNQLGFLQRCIESLIEKTRYPAYEILIIDNDSDDAETRTYLDMLTAQKESMGGRLRVLRYPGAFNFSAMNNMAVDAAHGDYVLLLNNDTAALHEDWLDEMVSHALRPEVGIVGAKLLYPDGKIQHAGVILGMKGPAEHPFIGHVPEDRGYFGRAMLAQNYSAVTGACLLISKSLYQEVGGLDEQQFKVSYNDIDLCLKVREAGHKIVWTPWAMLLHEGSASQKGAVEQKAEQDKLARFAAEKNAFYARWLPQLAFDPAYNRHLSLASTDFLLEDQAALIWDPEWRPRPRILVHPADREGCGEYRIISPMRALRAAGKVQGWETMRIFEPAEMERLSPDSIVLQRQMEWPQIEALERHKRLHKAFRVFEIDDLITNLPVKSVHKGQIHKDIAKRFRKAAGLCDRLVVATEPLAQAYKGFSDEVRVQPNCLERAIWGDLQPRRRAGAKPRVGWAGGVGHTGDLELVADVVRDLASAVEWVFFGLCPEALRPYVHEFHPGVPLPQYPAKLASLDLDLAIAPLEENPFNDAKSHLRILEYGVLGFPVVCSDITPYRGDFPVWRVANRYRDWMKAIREAISDRAMLAAAGDTLRDQVRAHWMLEDRLDDWLRVWLP